MHFTGRTWRPPYEASSFILQATSGCTYHQCRFCSLYKNEPYKMSPMEEFEEDLAELKHYQPDARRIFLTGANPFAMSYEKLKLRAMGINGMSIGTESGDDETLLLTNKGYASQDILEQCRKLDEADMEYYFVYMTGLAGYRVVSAMAGWNLYSFGRKGPSERTTDINQQITDTDTPAGEFHFQLLPGYCLPSKGKEIRHSSAAEHY